MHEKTFQNSFKLFLFTFFLLISFQNAFSQKSLIENDNNFYPLHGSDVKAIATTRQRVFKVENQGGAKRELETETAVSVKISTSVLDLEHRVFALVNERRAEAGLPALVWNNDAAKMARMHSENMANFKFFSHIGLDGKKVSDRAGTIGLKNWRQIGENIALNRGFKSPLESAVQSWMNSAGHRENILKTDWQNSGVGVAVAADGTYYFTQVFLEK
ncbi:MAG: CAP domain-containing protein [Acidobacteriota bacterium]|nr:CAP domain-containing protein [Acidobacteriota bacterium]